MKAYGMTKFDTADVDVVGCRSNGRATAVYAVNGRAYRGLRGGKKAAIRRHAKRVARAAGKVACKSE